MGLSPEFAVNMASTLDVDFQTLLEPMDEPDDVFSSETSIFSKDYIQVSAFLGPQFQLLPLEGIVPHAPPASATIAEIKEEKRAKIKVENARTKPATPRFTREKRNPPAPKADLQQRQKQACCRSAL
jgi:hypothetical protein